MTTTDKFAFWCVLAPALIDYRTQTPSAVTVGLYGALVMVSLLGAASLLYRHGAKRSSRLNTFALVAAVFVLVSCVSGAFHGQELAQIVRGAPPLVLLPVGLMSISALAASGADARSVWKQVLCVAALAAVFQLVLAFGVRGVSLSTVRYEVLTGASPMLSGYAVALALFGGFTFGASLLVALHLGSVFLSVTRTQLVAAIAAAGFAIAAAGLRTLGGRRIAVVTAVLAGMLALGLALPGQPLTRWTERFTAAESQHYGIDITAEARRGEARYQINQLITQPVGLLFGFGVAAPTAQDQFAQRLQQFILGSRGAGWSEAGVGHNNYVGTIFIGGLLAGGALILAQLIALGYGFVAIRRLMQPGLFLPYRVMIGPILGYAAYAAFGILAGSFGSRSTTLFMAATMGLTIWVFEATGRAKSR